MSFDYPKPLQVGARKWARFDSWVVLAQGNQIMYRQDPVAALKNSAYDHISIVLGDGPEFRPKDNELHVTLRCSAPFVMGAGPTIRVGQGDYNKSDLVFYWDYDLKYDPPSLTLSNKGNLNAGRPAKCLNQQLSSVAIPGGGLVSGNQALKDLRANTEAVRNPADYAQKLWEDLIKSQPVTIQIQSNDKDDSLTLDYELTGPGLAAPKKDKFLASGCLVVTAETAKGVPSLCSILLPGHARDPISLEKRGTTYMLAGGRYTCTIG